MPRATYADLDEDDPLDLSDERPARRARRRLPWLRMLLLSGLSIAALAYFAKNAPRKDASGGPKTIPSSVLIAPAPVWRPVPASGSFAIEKISARLTQEAREHSHGGREDTLTLGALGDSRHARIVLAQNVTERPRSFFVDLVRRAAEAGLSVTRNAQSRMVATKFGPVETAAVTLAGNGEQNCQAFRFGDAETGFGFHGWLCGGDAQPVDEAQAGCLVDSLALAGNAGSPSLKALFTQAEKRRSAPCPPPARIADPAGMMPIAGRRGS